MQQLPAPRAPHQDPAQRSAIALAPLSLAVGIGLLILAGCSAEAYRLAADEEVYGILADKRQEALGPKAQKVLFEVEAKKNALRQQLEERIAKGETPKLQLTAARALEIAAENSRDFQDQKERLYLSALALTGQRNRFSTIFGAGSSGTVSGVGNPNGPNPGSQGNVRSDASASKILASGARVLGSFVNNFFRVFTRGGGWDVSSLLGLSITQPLLEGFGREVTLEPLTQAERNTVYSIRNFERFRRTFVVTVLQDYLAILESRNSLENQLANLESLKLSAERTQALADAGRLPKFQVDQAQQSKLSTENGVINTRANLQQRLDSFKIRLGLPMDVELELDDGVLEQLRALGVQELSLTEGQATKLAFERRLDWFNSVAQVEDAERGVRVAANALKLGLDISAGVEVPNVNDKKAFKFDWKRFEWELGLDINLPLNKVNERNTYRQAMLGFDAERRAHSLLEDNIKEGLRRALRDVEASLRRYRINENAVQLAQFRVDSTKELIDAGRAQTRDFLESQSALLRAQNDLTSALVDYVLNKLRLLRDLEMLNVGKAGLELDLNELKRWSDGAKPEAGAEKGVEAGEGKTPSADAKKTPETAGDGKKNPEDGKD